MMRPRYDVSEQMSQYVANCIQCAGRCTEKKMSALEQKITALEKTIMGLSGGSALKTISVADLPAFSDSVNIAVVEKAPMSYSASETTTSATNEEPTVDDLNEMLSSIEPR